MLTNQRISREKAPPSTHDSTVPSPRGKGLGSIPLNEIHIHLVDNDINSLQQEGQVFPIPIFPLFVMQHLALCSRSLYPM